MSRPTTRRVIGLVMMCGFVFGTGTFAHAVWGVFHPSQQVPEHADAIVVLAGGKGERRETALALAADGRASNVVFNAPDDWALLPEGARIRELCADSTDELIPPGVAVSCVVADPDSTKGEAMTFSRIAGQQGWESIIVVTSDFHLERASRWFDRCLETASYTPVAAPTNATNRQFRHEIAALAVQLFVDRKCR